MLTKILPNLLITNINSYNMKNIEEKNNMTNYLLVLIE